jgi:formylglycine-generating enzyme required for sulfatase activity
MTFLRRYMKVKYYLLILIIFIISACSEKDKQIITVEMVKIPSGEFIMGNTGSCETKLREDNQIQLDIIDGIRDMKPTHSVTLTNSFYMSKYEITQSQFKNVMGYNPSYHKGDSLPVEEVSWIDAIEFCNKLSELHGLQKCYIGSNYHICDWEADGYRLPTEAEWEYACKAGTNSDYYNGELYEPNSNYDRNIDQIAWYRGNSNNRTHPVGWKKPNAFNLYDMIGNVAERCWDEYVFYTSQSLINPKSEMNYALSSLKTVRGGAFNYKPLFCISAYRLASDNNDITTNDTGFRIVRNSKQ